MAMAIGAVRTWTRKPLIPNAVNSDGRAARRQRAVGVDQLLPLDDRRQVGVVGRVEERRQDRRQRRHDAAAARTSGRRARRRPGSSRAATARPRSAQIRTGRRRRRSTQAPATSPKTSVGDRARGCAGARPRPPPNRGRGWPPAAARCRVTSDPKIEIVAALQTRTKAWLRQRVEANGLRTDRGA